MILYWYSEDSTGTLFADVLDDAAMCILSLAVLGKEGYEVIDPDGQVVGHFPTVDQAQMAALTAVEKWLDS